MPAVPTLTNADGQSFPEMSSIAREQWHDESTWVMDRLIPVVPSRIPFRRLTKWDFAQVLPTIKRFLRARGDVGPLVGTIKPDYEDFFVDQGQLRMAVTQEEIDEATEQGYPDRPWEIRTRLTVSGLRLANELAGVPYFTPGSTEFTAAEAVAVAAPFNWHDDATPQIGETIKGGVAEFVRKFGRKPNGFIIDQDTDTWFLEKLTEERKVSIQVGDFGVIPDLLPSANGVRIAGMLGVVPGARKEGTPGDSVFTPEWAWGEYPYFTMFYSPVLENGGDWNEVGDAYVFNGEYRPDGEVPLEVRTWQDSDFAANKLWKGRINFNRALKPLKPLCMSFTGIR